MEIHNDTLCLEGENGLGRRLTGKQSLKRTCENLEDTPRIAGSLGDNAFDAAHAPEFIASEIEGQARERLTKLDK